MINGLSSVRMNGIMHFKGCGPKGANSGTFTNLFQDASQQVKGKEDSIGLSVQSPQDVSAITEKGKKSTGNRTLTNVQKQYLRDKYNLSDPSKLSDSGLNQLLAELTNEGVLSYQDYLRADARPATPPGVVIVTSGESKDHSLSSSKNYGDYFGQVIQEEKANVDYMKQNYGMDAPASYNNFIEAHQRIEDILNSL